ncbi:uncharacterized protein ELE39_002282 [Cryptosporidium sp. chipmunk genotype I]|uniref:uncharacterized protein n=1 Tax=Cryptosporidium sp. chipmunk genotype I TaxID=1280935 RepID=UPI00351A9792|nr:hypothetical protein ELE39_002282 [Cryptosporidium sp. chipmunk genotype I]
MDDNSKKVDDIEVLDLLRKSRNRVLKDSDEKKSVDNELENEDMDIDEEEEEEEDEEGEEEEEEEEEEEDEEGEEEEKLEMTSDSDSAQSDERPEFEREAELAKEYEYEAQAKRKYELLYKNKKSPSNKQDSALMKLRNARQRKIKGMRLTPSDDEEESEQEEYNGKESEENEDIDDEEEDEDYYEEYDGKHRRNERISKSKRKARHSESDSEEYDDGDNDEQVKSKGQKRSRRSFSGIQESSLFDDDNQSQERMLRRYEKVLESINLKLMKSVHLTKDRIEFMLEHPKFNEYLCGSYVKVPIINPSTNSEIFLTCEVFDSHISDQNQCVLTLQRGGSKKEWGIESISNNIFTNEDLLEWKAMIKEFYSNDPEYILSLPRILQKKARDLNNFQYGDDDIALILERKQKKASNNSLSGKTLIETRTNLQTQIKQLEAQLKNIGLDNVVRKSKLAKIDQLQQELEQTVTQIEKLKLQKEMIHPDKSLRITSSRYIGGVQGKGSGTMPTLYNKSNVNENIKDSRVIPISNTNKTCNSLYKLIFEPVSPRNYFKSTLGFGANSNNDHNNAKFQLLSSNSNQIAETHFGRRECRPSVMWETKRNKPSTRQPNNSKLDSSDIQEISAIPFSEQNKKPSECFSIQGTETIKSFAFETEEIISEFEDFCSKVDLNLIASARNNSPVCVPPIYSLWYSSEFSAKSNNNNDLNSKFQELVKLATGA